LPSRPPSCPLASTRDVNGCGLTESPAAS
jgi:hypothetical protein